jgi:simple sugar transport system substrate-binding protein
MMKINANRAQRLAALTAAATLVAVTAAGCSSGGDGGSTKAADNVKITVVSGPLADPFFSAMKKGTEQAGKDLGVSVEWTAPKDLSNIGPDMARLSDAALAGKPDGVVMSDFLPDSQDAAVKKIVAADIPMTFMNSGINWEKLGALNFIGEDPTVVGAQVGERFVAAGKKNVICVNHAPGVPAVQQRCDALKAVLDKSGVKFKQVNVPLSQATNPTALTNAVAGALHADSSIDGVFTLGSGGAESAARAIDKSGSKAMLMTTDLSTNVLKLIQEGKIAAASDQQPWLTGYYSVEILVHYIRTGMHPIGHINTAPNWISKDNAAEVLRMNKELDGIRGAK